MSYLNLVVLILLALWKYCFILPFHMFNHYLLMAAIFYRTVEIELNSFYFWKWTHLAF